MGHLLGYARVSTTDQQPQLQVDALTAAGCYRVFTETASGARPDRPTLAQLLDQLRPGDTLVVWKLDRLGRSLRHLVDSVTGLAERGIGFRSLQEAIDTTTPGGKLVFHVFAALAEFERDLIRERTSAGLAAARARGRQGGRPSVMTAHKLKVARDMHGSGQYTDDGDRHDPRGQPSLDLPPPPPGRLSRPLHTSRTAALVRRLGRGGGKRGGVLEDEWSVIAARWV
jgi:DNA invertase Pin-like site-specific DNA recombinase